MKKSQRFRRNQKIIKFINEHPEYSLVEVGEKYGLTAQAIFYIKKNEQALAK